MFQFSEKSRTYDSVYQNLIIAENEQDLHSDYKLTINNVYEYKHQVIHSKHIYASFYKIKHTIIGQFLILNTYDDLCY